MRRTVFEYLRKKYTSCKTQKTQYKHKYIRQVTIYMIQKILTVYTIVQVRATYTDNNSDLQKQFHSLQYVL